MLFNSYTFICAFLPVTLVGFYAAALKGDAYIRCWLAGASLYFYGFWNASYLPLLIGSIAFNYVAAQAIQAIKGVRPAWCTPTLICAVACNLGLLGFFKYAVFFQNVVAQLVGLPGTLTAVSVPLGISFFTFTQIAYLVDVTHMDKAERDPVRYALFVNFFPHLIAGPILYHRDTIPQFSFNSVWPSAVPNVAVGATMFSFGLFKKVVLADNAQPFVSFAFAEHSIPDLYAAWTGVLAYTMQIYFDFSGYSDMAIGLARMFGVVFPANFNSPYQAISIIDFWRRWHMTLSKFLRNYLYIPLGGNRSGLGQYSNIIITMFLGGLWHGAGWTFIVWGMLHGFYLIINHAWRRAWSAKPAATQWWGRELKRCATFLAVVVAWVFFRSERMDDAITILTAMVGMHGVGSIGTLCGQEAPGGCALGVPVAWYCVAGLLAIAMFAPNTQQMLSHWKPVLGDVGEMRGPIRPIVMPTIGWAIIVGVALAFALAGLNERSQFLYYQF